MQSVWSRPISGNDVAAGVLARRRSEAPQVSSIKQASVARPPGRGRPGLRGFGLYVGRVCGCQIRVIEFFKE